MITISKLRNQAINAAKVSNWQVAAEANEQILQQTPNDVSTLNRLGLAYLQLNEKKKAKECFQQALSLDKTNNIAKRQLERISSKQAAVAPAFHREYFIEEPGRTKIVELHRLAGKQIVDMLSVGQLCNLVLKKRYISIETEDGVYIGALPEDISFRLSKLISDGNTYSCRVHTVTAKTLTVYLKELSRSKKNQDVHSFPMSKNMASPSSDMDDRFLLEDEEMPVEATDHDNDEPEVDEEPEKNYHPMGESIDVES